MAALFPSFIMTHRFPLPLPFLAHRALAAFLAICFLRLGEIVFMRTLADFRPIAAKYSDSFLSIMLRILYATVEHLYRVMMQLIRYCNWLNDSP
jgi:hypothetical protein